MAIHSLDLEALKELQSTSAYRLELNNIEEEFLSECVAEEEGEIECDDVVGMARIRPRGARSLTSKIVVVARKVASTASAVAYNKSLLDIQQDLNKLYKDAIQQEIEEILDNDCQTLTQFIRRTEEIRKKLEAVQRSYYVEYQDKRAEVQAVIKKAEQDYEKEMQELTSDLAQFDDDCKKELSPICASLERLKKKHADDVKSFEAAMNEEIKTANQQYDAEKKRILSECNPQNIEQELYKAELKRDEQKVQAVKLYELNANRCMVEYKQQTALLEQQLAELTQRRNDERKAMFDNRVADAQTRRNSVINHHNDVIQASQIKHVNANQWAKHKNNNAQTKFGKYKSQLTSFGKARLKQGAKYALANGTVEEQELIQRVNADREASKIATDSGKTHIPLATDEDYQMALQVSMKYASDIMLRHIAETPTTSKTGKYEVEYNNRILGSGATDFIKAIEKNHIKLGEELVMMFGSAEEISVLTSVDDDIRAKLAASRGDKLYLSLASASDYKRADKIVLKYAGNIGTKDNVKKTLESYVKISRRLMRERDALKKDIAIKADEAKQLELQVQDLQQDVGQIVADQLAVKTGKDSDGIKLTQSQRELIVKRIQDGNAAEKTKMLAELKTKQNVLNIDLENLQEKLTRTNAVIANVQVHESLLKKHGQVVSSVFKGNESVELTFASVKKMDLERVLSDKVKVEANENLGTKGAQVNKTQNNDVCMLCASARKIQNGITNIYKTNSARRRSSISVHADARNIEPYEIALYASTFSRSVANVPAGLKVTSGEITFRKIGDNTAMDRVLAENDIVKRTSNRKAFGGGAANATVPIQSSNQPIEIPSQPIKLTKLPQKITKKVADGTLRFTRKSVGAAVSFSGHRTAVSRSKRVVKKPIVSKSTTNNTMANRLTLMHDRLSSFAKNLSITKIARISKRIISGLIGTVVSCFTTMIGTIASGFMTMSGFGALAGLAVIVLMLLLSMICSTFPTMLGLPNNTFGNDQTLVKNYPQYILIHATNYRNAELEIFELFNLAANEENQVKIQASEDPVYYSLYNGMSDIFKAPGPADERELKAINQSAFEVFEHMKNNLTYDSISDLTSDDFLGQVQTYDNVKLSYYYSDQVREDGNGNYYYIGPPSEYEISNAKDALAIVDTLYTTKYETMQRLEVLAYLGVGEYQLGHANTDKAVNNLFWASHKIIYNSGTKEEDVWFHDTSYDATTLNDVPTHTVDEECDNMQDVSVIIGRQVPDVELAHQDLDDFERDRGNADKNPYGEYIVPDSACSTAQDDDILTPTAIYYYYGCITDPTITLSNGTQIQCDLTTETITVDIDSFGIDEDALEGTTSFVPRLTAPAIREPYWTTCFYNGIYGLNPFPILHGRFTGDVLPNCTAWAYGRFYELLGEEPLLSWNNAEYWFLRDRSAGGNVYERGQEPRLGAVICWQNGPIGNPGAGHVAIVEQINDDGSIITSESGYKSSSYWWTTRRDRNGRWDANGNYIRTGTNSWGAWGYKFQGFIYCPTVTTSSDAKLKFYSPDGNGTFYAVNGNKYLGRFVISDSCNEDAYNAMTKNGTINTTDGYLDLKYFELNWNGENYETQIAYWSDKTGQIKYTDTKFVKDCPRPTLDIDEIQINCRHEEQVFRTVGDEYIIQMCMGHADLDVAIAVSLIDGGDAHPNADNQLFEDAMRVDGLILDTENVNFRSLGISYDLDLAGWKGGSGFVYTAFNPTNDWGYDTGNRNLARAKMELEMKYEISNDLVVDQLLSYQGGSEKYEIRHQDINIETEFVEVENEPVYFSDDITIDYQGYVNDGEHIPYYLFAPSDTSDYDIPLIIWLHGSGEKGASPSIFENRGIMPTLMNWNLSGVNAYIVCPQLQFSSQYNNDAWHAARSTNSVKALIDYMVNTYNVDANRIYLAGHSLGGQGALYMASQLPGYFAACAILSPYQCGLENNYVYDSEIIVIAGRASYGEDPNSVYVAQQYARIIGADNVYYANSNHANLPRIVFTADDDNNGNSDIVEWLFQHARDGSGNGNTSNRIQTTVTITETSFSPLAKSPNGLLLYGMRLYGTTYYVESFTSGAQVNMPVYTMNESSGQLLGPNTLSICVD